MYMYRDIQYKIYLLWPWNKVEVHQWLSLLPAKQVVNNDLIKTEITNSEWKVL